MRIYITSIDRHSFQRDIFLEKLSREAIDIKLLDSRNGTTDQVKVIMVFKDEPLELKDVLFKEDSPGSLRKYLVSFGDGTRYEHDVTYSS